MPDEKWPQQARIFASLWREQQLRERWMLKRKASVDFAKITVRNVDSQENGCKTESWKADTITPIKQRCMNLGRRALLTRLVRSFAMGFGLFALGALVQGAMVTRGVRGVSEYADDLILGLLAGLLVFAYEQKRHNAMMKRIQVIADMNHHVRNALQAITLSRYAEQAQQIELIDESTKRIQWALRELLPQTHEAGSRVSVGGLSGSTEGTPHSKIFRT